MLERVKQRVVGIGQRLGARAPFLKTAWRVQKRFGELNGSYLASAVTLAAFLSLFPLLLVAIAVIGFVAGDDPSLGRDAAKFLGLTGDARELVVDTVEQAEESKSAASIVGLTGLLWSGLGLVATIQYAMDQVWQVTGRGMKDKLFGLAWLVGAAVLFVSSLAVTSLIGLLPGFFAPLNIAVGLALSLGLFLWTMKVLPHRSVGWKALLPGAVVGAVGLEVLKVVGGIYVPRAVASSSAMYGSIGVVFAVLAWLFFFGRLLVYASVTNVVRWEEDHGTIVIDIRVPNLPSRDQDDDATRAGQHDPHEVGR